MPTIESIIAERETTHGDYKEQAAFAQNFKRMMRAGRSWEQLDYYQAQSMEAFCDKIARILAGNFNDIDHWRDISGYAALVVRELEQLSGAERPEVPGAKAPTGVRPRPDDEPLDTPEFLTRMEQDLPSSKARK